MSKILKVVGKVVWALVNVFGLMALGGSMCSLYGSFSYWLNKEKNGSIATRNYQKAHPDEKYENSKKAREYLDEYFDDVVKPGLKMIKR